MKRQKWTEADRKAAREQLMAMDRAYYINSLGFRCFEWQEQVLRSTAKRKVINGGRQSGKSTVVSGVPCHTARFVPGSISIIGAPTENQANETMQKVLQFIRLDPDYPALRKCSTEEIELENGSRIIVRTAKSDTFRGYSCPRVIILDEASRIEEDAYTSGARPMLTDNPHGELYLISTPFGQEGFFYRAFTGDGEADTWDRYEVRSPYHAEGSGSDTHLVSFGDEEDYRTELAARGVKAWYSPRHKDFEFQKEQLREMGRMQYQQEYECMFIEKSGQVFSYGEISAMFGNGEEGGVQPWNNREPQFRPGPQATRFVI